MRTTDENIRLQRTKELPTAILDLSMNDEIVSRSLHRFVTGEIITPEECLCQMVKDLSVTLQKTRQMVSDRLATEPISVPSLSLPSYRTHGGAKK